jgi:uncharacterized protein
MNYVVLADAPVQGVTTIEEIPTLEVVYKISERCNLACDYCYFFFKGDDSYKSHPPLASGQLTRSLVDFLNDAVSSYNIKTINLVLHGGEPLMMPKAKFIALCETLKAEYVGKVPLNIAMQTNGALITPEWIEILERFNVGVGVSFDGPAHINDQHRIDTKGRPSYAACRKGWDLLQACDGLNPPGLLSVLNPNEDADEIFDHFVDDLGAFHLNFLLPDYTHDTVPDGDYAIRVGEALIRIFNNWARRADSSLQVRFIQETVFPLFDLKSLAKARVVGEDLRNQMSISSNGEIHPEDTVKVLPGYHVSEFNVATSKFSDVCEGQTWKDMGVAALRPPEQCGTCEWLKICRGGRLHHRHSLSRGFDNPSVYCAGLKAYFEHIAAAAVCRGADVDDLYNALTEAA